MLCGTFTDGTTDGIGFDVSAGDRVGALYGAFIGIFVKVGLVEGEIVEIMVGDDCSLLCNSSLFFKLPVSKLSLKSGPVLLLLTLSPPTFIPVHRIPYQSHS